MRDNSCTLRQKLEEWNILLDTSVHYTGAEVSRKKNSDKLTLAAHVPTTLLGAMVEAGTLPNPREGNNFFELPGVPEQNVLDNFALREMPDGSPFKDPRWWITSFDVPALRDDKTFKNCVIEFSGINYSAEIWLNGKLIADSNEVAGTYRKFIFDISEYITLERNILALKIYPQSSDDLAFSFVDWHPMPPDKCTGIWRDVNLIWFSDVRINDFSVQSRLNKDYSKADIIVLLEIYNAGNKPLSIDYQISCRYFSIHKEIIVQPGLNTIVEDSTSCHDLLVESVPLWWPYQMGEPELVEVDARIGINELPHDQKKIFHGFRELTSHLNKSGDRQFVINGKDILIRGAAWAPDMLLKESERKDQIDVLYLKDMGLNALRFEGNFGSDNLWDICDRKGILIMAGWTCNSFWEEYDSWTNNTYVIAGNSLKSLLRRFRNHASFVVWFNGSDLLAPPHVEKMYLEILDKEIHGLVPVASAGKYVSEISGNTGVKMSGPYSYVPPVYWYLKGMPGYASGFNTETGPDVSIPPFESLARMFPKNQMEVGSSSWNLHAGMRQFRGTEIVENALVNRYGSVSSLEMFSKKAQVLSYESWRAMFEAAVWNRGKCTGIIGWMLTNSWPSVIWHLYDSYLYPTGGYFGTKKACSLVHVILNYNEYSIYSVNNTLKDLNGAVAEVELYSLNEYGNQKLIWSETFNADIPANSSSEIGCLPDFTGSSSLYFLFITLNRNNRIVGRNTYWLSDKPDVLTDKHVQFGTTEVSRYGDFSGLDNLPSIGLDVFCKYDAKDTYTFSLTNNSGILAFFVEVKLRTKEGSQLLPVLWTDNCISIRPGENVIISGEIPFPLKDKSDLTGEITGYNVNKLSIDL